MKTNKLVLVTLKLIFADMFLNFMLGFIFIFFYPGTERLIAGGMLFQPVVWCAIGTGLLLFGVWQTSIIRRRDLKPNELVFAALMAFVPAVLLAIGLFMDSPLYPFAKILLWAGVAYMLFLGCWYLFLARRLVNQSLENT